MPKVFILVLFAFSLPVKLLAAVTIHEVAWMGDAASANHEWIELRNDSSDSISVSGWTLSDDNSLAITLAGSLAGNTYAVLERSSDESAAPSAFLIYTGALVNTGATLTLRNEVGVIMDQVVGGENWQELGGDNATKETAQYSSRGWVTAAATPGAQNISAAPISPPSGTSSSSTSSPKTTESNQVDAAGIKSKSTGAKSTVRLGSVNPILKLAVDLQAIAYVNQTIPFIVTPSGVGDTIAESLIYTWNFGDSYTATGTKVSHFYAYPGTYVVTVRAVYAKHDVTERREITILPATFSITRNEYGDVQLHNDAPYDIDVSGYTVVGTNKVVLPARSIMAALGTLTIASKRLETIRFGSQISLYDTASKLVASTVMASAAKIVPIASVPETSPVEFRLQKETAKIVAGDMVESVPLEREAVEPTPAEDATKITADQAKTMVPKRWPYLALITVLLVALLVVFSKKPEVT